MISYKNDLAILHGKVLNNEDFIYVSDGTWFTKDSICRLNANCGQAGALMIGNLTRVNGEPHLLDEELCMWEEFDIYDSERNLLMKAVDD